MATIPIRKLKDSATSYYPLSVGESVVTTHPITVEHNVGKYKTGQIIGAVTSIDSILNNILTGKGGEYIEVDDEMSTTSPNPVQNKVITENFNDLKNQVEEVTRIIDSKVDSVIGESKIFNESDGGGAMYTSASTGIKSFVGVNDPASSGSISGIAGQLYVVNGEQKTKLNMYDGKFCYVKGANPVDDVDKSKRELAVKEDLDVKVDKEEGKGLSTNDFTDELKSKVENSVSSETFTEELAKKINSSEKGVSNGVAQLDDSGKVPSAQLPSYVDDIVEYDKKSDFPEPGESGKIYVARNTNKCYRWSGTQYVEVAKSLALGETAETAYAGDKGKANADNIAILQTGKVDKDEGKSLVLDAEIAKLATVEEGANKTVVDSALSQTSTNPLENKAIYALIKDLQDRVNNIEILLEDEWKKTTLKVDNVDSIETTNVNEFYLNTTND